MYENDDKFHAALQGEDELGVVVRAHIHLESHLISLFELFFQAPKYLSGFTYGHKVSLALACGLNPDFASPLKVLGKTRNTFAHKLDSCLDEQQVRSLYAAFSSANKVLIQKAFRNTGQQLEPVRVKFEGLSTRNRFILLVVTLDGMLIVAIREVKNRNTTSPSSGYHMARNCP